MDDASDTRKMAPEAARALRPGDDHYTAFVGPPAQYDFMGATQFRLLTALGLRSHHRVLDFGPPGQAADHRADHGRLHRRV